MKYGYRAMKCFIVVVCLQAEVYPGGVYGIFISKVTCNGLGQHLMLLPPPFTRGTCACVQGLLVCKNYVNPRGCRALGLFGLCKLYLYITLVRTTAYKGYLASSHNVFVQ